MTRKLRDEKRRANSPRKSRTEIDWRNPLTNEAVRICITHTRDYLASGTDHVEIESIKPAKTPLPISETGYRSHFMSAVELKTAGGPVAFVQRWIEREATSTTWIKAVTAKAQGDLFQWANARKDVMQRKRSAPTRPAHNSKQSRALRSGKRSPQRKPAPE